MYKQMIKNLHIFPSTQTDHLLSQKMNDKINMDDYICISFVNGMDQMLILDLFYFMKSFTEFF
jgi:hypothetical protein